MMKGKGMEESACGLFPGTIPVFFWMKIVLGFQSITAQI
jgi:hypothetical protein